MCCFKIIHNLIKYQSSIQSLIMFVALCFTGWQTWYLYNKSKEETRRLFKISAEEKQKDFLDSQLIELQRISFYDPFVEDENYTHKWLENKEKYLNHALNEDELKLFLKYDVYTEMLFNFIEKSLTVYDTEEKLLNYIDFKSWLRTHKECWENPLQAHSNRQVYGKEMYDMIEDWLK